MLKKFVIPCLVCFSLLTFWMLFPSFELKNSVLRHRDFLTDFYNGQTAAYTILDREGNVVTEQFYAQTLPYAQQRAWDKIEQYCLETIGSLCRTQTDTRKESAPEIKKTEVQDWIVYVDGMSGPNYENFRTQVDFELEGTIWYNADTGTITDAEADIVDVILQQGCGVINQQATASISSNKTSAKISCYIYTQYILVYDELQVMNPIKFDPAKHSFIMAGEPS